MWNIFNDGYTRMGVLDGFSEGTIQHNFYEVDTITFSVPYSKQMQGLLQKGVILQRPREKKAFVLHTIEIREDDNRIWGYGYGIESILDSRVIIYPRTFVDKHEIILHKLVEENLVNSKDSYRNFPTLIRAERGEAGTVVEEGYWGESVYAVAVDIGKRASLGFTIDWVPIDKQMIFRTRRGTDRSTQQTAIKPVRWVNEWRDTYDSILTNSEKDSKTNMYIVSGDETPIKVVLGDDFSPRSSWSRRETFLQATDIQQTLQDENQTQLTYGEVVSLLQSRGALELGKYKEKNDYTFTLSPDINEVYGVDYEEGDIVSVVNQTYGIELHKQIINVEEKLTGDSSTFTIKFDN